jgi:hypothetical protein
MINEELELAQELINSLNLNDKKCLKEIYTSKWDSISKPKDFGKKFKKAVKDNLLQNIIHIGIRDTGRCDEYRRI